MRAKFAITHAPFTGSTAADGTAGPPQYGTPVSREVFGWYPKSSELVGGAPGASSANDDYTHRVNTSLVVLVPDVSVYKSGDKVTIDSAAYLVSEDVRDFTTGPFGYKPGGQIVVEKTSG